MLRAYSRRVVNTVNQCHEMNTFIPALAYSFAQPSDRSGREARRACCRQIQVFALWADPSELGPDDRILRRASATVLDAGDGGVAGFRLLVRDPRCPAPDRRSEEGGLFTLFVWPSFFIGVALFGIGLLGEYIGRIYQEVRQRPRYVIAAILGTKDGPR
jgi:undecaprenyl-phosphate 4-deoxy-4-formamido-L-arabinose transferase